MTQIDHYSIRPTEASVVDLTPTEQCGHSTRVILANVGYSKKEIDTILATRIASEAWGREFLPS